MKDQVEGTLKEEKGKLTDDTSDELEGKAQKHWGEAKDIGKDKADEADAALTREEQEQRAK